MSSTKNNLAWMQLFEKYKIPEKIRKHGIFEISAKQINEFREARLMTKFDHRRNLPVIFKRHRLSILPITRGTYLISQFKNYKDFEEKETEIIRVPFPIYIESVNYENITSEAMALNCAYITGILADFINDEGILPTVSGRMSSGTFSFEIETFLGPNACIDVSNSQIEIDGGYEGIEKLALVEAKNFLSDDFLIRQVYYPYRLWRNKTSKRVSSLYMVYSNDIFTFYEYEFQEPNNYNSITLIKQKKYSIEETEIELEDILKVLDKAKIIKEPEVPFPQANSFKRVINLCELLNETELTKDEITNNYDFDPRQTNYYTDAGRYLGLIRKRREEGQIVFSLTDEGQRLFRLKYKPRQLKFVELILNHKVFNETLRLCIERGGILQRHEIVAIMKESNLYNIESEDTFYRRASTISRWIEWIFELTRL